LAVSRKRYLSDDLECSNASKKVSPTVSGTDFTSEYNGNSHRYFAKETSIKQEYFLDCVVEDVVYKKELVQRRRAYSSIQSEGTHRSA